jgi:hypothetical protein
MHIHGICVGMYTPGKGPEPAAHGMDDLLMTAKQNI